jgi:hypothetical protein
MRREEQTFFNDVITQKQEIPRNDDKEQQRQRINPETHYFCTRKILAWEK